MPPAAATRRIGSSRHTGGLGQSAEAIAYEREAETDDVRDSAS
jgi:hypothetical protein